MNARPLFRVALMRLLILLAMATVCLDIVCAQVDNSVEEYLDSVEMNQQEFSETDQQESVETDWAPEDFSGEEQPVDSGLIQNSDFQQEPVDSESIDADMPADFSQENLEESPDVLENSFDPVVESDAVMMEVSPEAVQQDEATQGLPVLLQDEKTDSVRPIASVDVIEDLPVADLSVIDRKKIIIDVLELRDIDIKDVLKLIAAKTGLNIIAGGNVGGRVTLFMQNVDVYDVLKIVLEVNDLAFVEEVGIVRVMTAQDYERVYGQKFGLKTKAKIVSLQGMKAVDAVVLLQQLKSVIGKVVADEQSNTVMIEDVEQNVNRMINYIQKVDAPTQTKVFELRYVQAEEISKKVQEMATPKLSEVRFDLRSNKIFVKDTQQNLEKIQHFINEVDTARATKIFDLSYAKAEDISKTITPALTPSLGTVEMDVRSNKIVVTDTASKILEIEKTIEALDAKESEVLIEAKIIQIDLSDAFKMGIDWEGLVSGYHDLDIKTAMGGLGSTVTKKGTLSIGTLSADKYTATLEALSTVGRTKVLSSPRIAVLNNAEAKILVGTTKPYVTTTTTTPSSGPTTTAESVNFIDVGVKLFVTPIIHNDGYVTMKIKPEVSSAATNLPTGSGNEIPIVDTSHVDTTIQVKDGVTIVIGGLIKEEQVSTINKIPLLGDIPILGHAFRNTDRRDATTEIVIFLTPHIITGDVHIEDPFKENPSLFESKN